MLQHDLGNALQHGIHVIESRIVPAETLDSTRVDRQRNPHHVETPVSVFTLMLSPVLFHYLVFLAGIVYLLSYLYTCTYKYICTYIHTHAHIRTRTLSRTHISYAYTHT